MIRAELIRLYRAWGYSRDGLMAAWAQDKPFRLEVVLSVIILPLALILGHTGIEHALLLGSWLMVPMVELLNSGLEAITDYATKTERHALAKKTKDVGSAAVLIAVLNFAAVWAFILF